MFRVTEAGRGGAVLLIVAIAAGLAAASSAATPRKYYWSEEKAEAIVQAKVGVPYCIAIPDDSKCANGAYRPDGYPILGRFRFEEVVCTGADEKAGTFTYSRFKCRFLVNYGYFRGSLAAYPTGRTTIRWKLLALYDCRPGRCDSP